MRTTRRLLLSVLAPALAVAGDGARPSAGEAPLSSHRIVEQGIAVELVVDSVEDSAGLEGERRAEVRFSVRDTASGEPLRGLRPAAWMERRAPGATAADGDRCTSRIRSFLSGSLTARAEFDLNTYYALSLNDDATISVVDPLFGYGGSKLLDMVFLDSPGEDWVMDRRQSRLFVSMPDSGRVAVVDTAGWRVERNIDVGPGPTRLALQPDERYLWVGLDNGEVVVIDLPTLVIAARLSTGAGPHDIAFTDDGLAFVTDGGAGTVSIVDVGELRVVRTHRVGRPTAIAFSAVAHAAFVTDKAAGKVHVIDAASGELSDSIDAGPSPESLRFAPGDRLAFVLSPAEDRVRVLDAATRRITESSHIEGEPARVAFTSHLAYIQRRRSEIVLTVPLAEIEGSEGLPIADFPGGQRSIVGFGHPSLADTIVEAPEGVAVLLANAADGMIYYYLEGMAAPMGSFRNYGRRPRAVLVLDRSLRETSPGVYSTAVDLPDGGAFDVAFFLDAPRITRCLDLMLPGAASPTPVTADEGLAIRLTTGTRPLIAGEEYRLRFRATSASGERPLTDLRAVGVLAMLAPGTWQQRRLATPVGEGVYEARFTPPESGIYYVFFRCPSRGVAYRDVRHLTLRGESAPPRQAQRSPAADASAETRDLR